MLPARAEGRGRETNERPEPLLVSVHSVATSWSGGRLSRSNKDGFSVTTKSDDRSWIEQPIHWWAIVALLYVVIGLLSAIGSILIFQRIFQGRWEQIFWRLFPCRDCRLLPKLRCLFRGLNSCLAN